MAHSTRSLGNRAMANALMPQSKSARRRIVATAYAVLAVSYGLFAALVCGGVAQLTLERERFIELREQLPFWVFTAPGTVVTLLITFTIFYVARNRARIENATRWTIALIFLQLIATIAFWTMVLRNVHQSDEAAARESSVITN